MPYMYLVPVFGVALAVLFLGETLSGAQIIGGLLVLAGISLARSA
jgi:drug/metabolite transporter (DMT)-like permease